MSIPDGGDPGDIEIIRDLLQIIKDAYKIDGLADAGNSYASRTTRATTRGGGQTYRAADYSHAAAADKFAREINDLMEEYDDPKICDALRDCLRAARVM